MQSFRANSGDILFSKEIDVGDVLWEHFTRPMKECSLERFFGTLPSNPLSLKNNFLMWRTLYCRYYIWFTLKDQLRTFPLEQTFYMDLKLGQAGQVLTRIEISTANAYI